MNKTIQYTNHRGDFTAIQTAGRAFLSRLARTAAVLLATLAAAFAPDGRAEASIGYFEAIKKDADPAPGGEYYLRHNIKTELGSHDSTNYWRGDLAPVNTKARLVSIGEGGMVIQIVETGKTIKVDLGRFNKSRGMSALAKNMLSTAPVPVEKFSAAAQAGIKSGEVALGMTKEQVVITRGYPPAHKTPSLEQDRWTYWNSRFVTLAYAFENGVLIRGRGLK